MRKQFGAAQHWSNLQVIITMELGPLQFRFGLLQQLHDLPKVFPSAGRPGPAIVYHSVFCTSDYTITPEA